VGTPKQLDDGRFYANVGYTIAGSRSQPKFMLGRNPAQAITRCALIDQLWDRSVEVAREMGEQPAWDEVGLAIAREIAAGETTIYVRIEAGDSPDVAVGILTGWQEVVPGVRLQLRDEAAQERGVQLRRQEAQKLISLGRDLLETGGSQTLHEGIKAYVASVRLTPQYLISDKTRLTDWGKVKIDLIEFCADHMPDVPLTDLKMQKINELLNILGARPPKKTPGGVQTKIPITRKYASTLIKEFRQFLNWLHEADEFLWEKPRDYAVKPIRVKRDAVKSGPVRVATYDLPELVTLWKYATPWERCLMALALNTSFGMAEVATLTREEILLRTKHPHASELKLVSDDRDSWIRRHRGKTSVYGEWKLWGVTVTVVEWLLQHRPRSSEPYLVLTKEGTPLKVEGQRNTQIAKAWTRLLNRVRADHPTFRKLSFNKLRKTASNWIRQNHGDYLGELMLSHGEPCEGDLNAYTNERFADLHAATEKLREWLEPVFSSVLDPFPVHEKLGGANISRGTIDRIIELHLAGDRVALVAEKVNVSTETARRWIKRYQAEQARLQTKTA
jgi:Helix-turn-helix domain